MTPTIQNSLPSGNVPAGLRDSITERLRPTVRNDETRIHRSESRIVASTQERGKQMIRTTTDCIITELEPLPCVRQLPIPPLDTHTLSHNLSEIPTCVLPFDAHEADKYYHQPRNGSGRDLLVQEQASSDGS